MKTQSSPGRPFVPTDRLLLMNAAGSGCASTKLRSTTPRWPGTENFPSFHSSYLGESETWPWSGPATGTLSTMLSAGTAGPNASRIFSSAAVSAVPSFEELPNQGGEGSELRVARG